MAIQVIDSGIGIEPDRLSSIFDSFTQADDTISKRFGGTGLGLTISAMLAKQMGGEIRVTSKLGTGSCFALHLPLPAATTPSLPLGQAVPINPLTTAVNVLVAEDNRTNMLITRRILAGQVAQMSEATDGQSAVLMWQEEAPDMILMDISMPVMDGLAAAKAIRALEQKLGRPRCKILALTASSHWENQEACRAAGFDGYLVKPFRREALLQAIAEHCGSASALPVARSA
jgi:CheY-like chemotaxis protein